METISLFFLIEAIGTIAFASSGAMTAIRKRLDLLGVIILGETTAVGGGMLRDILHILTGPYIVIYERIMNIFDAVGLAAFTVTGIDTAMMAGYGDYRFLSIFLGVLTGVGGGVLRDIMAGQTPYILKKHVYACASLAGALFYVYLSDFLGESISMVAAAFLVVLIRLLATRYCWDLPKATTDEIG